MGMPESMEVEENLEDESVEEELDSGILDEEIDWLEVANDAFDNSDSYFGSSIKKQIEKNIDAFNSRHSSGSKYNSDSYRYRSKIYRPKTRSTIRRHEAAAATAYFSTSDVISCEPYSQNDEMAVFGAYVAERLVNERLQEPNLKWFQTCIGAYQDAMVQGVVISKQEWLYKEKDEENGIIRVVEDRPSIETIPVENFRFDPNSDWRNPIEDSPYLIEMLPMYRADVKAKMKAGDWNELDDDAIYSEKSSTARSVSRKRSDERQNPKDIVYENSDYDLVLVHRNIINVEGDDYIFYTLGKTELLSDPVLLTDEYPDGRFYTMGFCNLETHKVFPAAPVELLSQLQREANEIANQRLDNVKLVVNRRTFVRRSAKVDLRGLTNSVPGGVTLVEDVDRDVRHDAPPDVTSSSYAEQDRLNNDFDELAGSFSGSSVASNRAVNETVGGMELMSQDANSVTDYQLRVFSETWLKPTLRQILRLERMYESDPIRLKSASGIDDNNIVIKALRSEIKLTLSVGFGATNPQKQVEKLSFALNTIGQYMPQMLQKLKPEAVMSEVFGSLGYQDGKRFFDLEEGVDPQVQEMQKVIQQLQQQLQSKQMENQTKVQVEQVKQQGNMQREQLRNQTNMRIAELDQQIAYIKQQIAAEQNDLERGKLMISKEAFDFSKKEKELNAALTERNRMSDLLMNDDYGMAPFVEEQKGRG